MNYCWQIFESEWGSILLISSEKGLVRSTLPTQNPKAYLDDFMIHCDGIVTHRESSILARAKKQLQEYFDQKRDQFFVALDLHGTHFQKKVWFELKNIPFGQTRCYQDIATAIGSPRGARAIGGANHENPVPIFIPCHRVISKSGSLGGFADGSDACLKLKKQLLELEKNTLERFQFAQSTVTCDMPILGNVTPKH